MEKIAQEDEFTEIESRLDHPPLTWAPKGALDGVDADKQHVAPKVAGVVESVEVWESEYGPYPVIDLKLKDGTRVRIHAFSTVLKKRLGGIDPQIGELIGVAYLGEVKSRTPGRKSYSNFSAVRSGAGQAKSLRQFAGVDDMDTVAEEPDGGKPEQEPAEGGEW